MSTDCHITATLHRNTAHKQRVTILVSSLSRSLTNNIDLTCRLLCADISLFGAAVVTILPIPRPSIIMLSPCAVTRTLLGVSVARSDHLAPICARNPFFVLPGFRDDVAVSIGSLRRSHPLAEHRHPSITSPGCSTSKTILLWPKRLPALLKLYAHKQITLYPA